MPDNQRCESDREECEAIRLARLLAEIEANEQYQKIQNPND